MKRFSKKRNSVEQYLKNTKSHPSAENIYTSLKPQLPDLSLGTVYRNLNELIEDGKAVIVGKVHGKDRFDGKTDPHIHAICSKCGKIIDVDKIDIPSEILYEAERQTRFTFSHSNLQLIGICEDCKNSQEKNEK